jgi:hypothetical protein
MNYLVYFADAGFNVKLSEIKQRAIELGYKPADETPLDNGADWYCYEAQKAVAFPPVGVECQYLSGNGKWDSCSLVFVTDYVVVIEGLASGTEKVQIAYNFGYWPDFRPLDYNLKAEAEKKRVVDAAYNAIAKPNGIGVDAAIAELYDAGFLRMPDGK